MVASTLFAVIVAFLTSVPIIILKFFLTFTFLKPLGIMMTLGLIGFCFFITLTNAALMGVDKSNDWAFSYFNSWLIDSFFI